MKTVIRYSRHTTRMLVPALAVVLVLGGGRAARAACYDPGQQLPAQAVSRFINEPGKLLTQFPNGGPQMISLIRDLVASDPGTLPLITELNTRANPDQVRAIGAGLGQAALVCAHTAQAFSEEIQKVTIAANNKPMTEAFGAVMGNQFLGLANPGVGGGGAEATGQTGSTGGTTAAGRTSLSLSTSVSTASTASSGFAPSTAAVGVSGNQSSSAGSQGNSASAGSPGASTSAGSPGGSTSGGSPSTLSLATSPGGSPLAETAGSSLFTVSPSSSLFGPTPNSVSSNTLSSNTLSFTVNAAATINSPTSVSPSRPR
jgi:hypothetical protein